MSHQLLHHRFTIDVDASGDFTETTSRSYNGYIVKVDYSDGDLADGIDLTITAGGGLGTTAILTDAAANDDKIYYPVVQSHDLDDGSEIAESTISVWQRIHVSGTITCLVANGGVSKSGSAVVWVEE